jgi:hypothetical protein
MTTPKALHSSASQEHFTPAYIVEPARAALNGFDLDPATTPFANELVRATKIYTHADDGLVQPWGGKVFLNPPGGTLRQEVCGTKSEQALWWGRLANAWQHGEVEAAIFIGFSLELLQVAQGIEPAVMQPLDFPVCVPSKRIRFDALVDDVIARLVADADQREDKGQLSDKWRNWFEKRLSELEPLRGQRVSGDQPTHGNLVVLLPSRTDPGMVARFSESFAPIGFVHV